jgi:hypothetical protein
MRGLTLIAAMALVSTASYADQSRGLSLVSTEASQPAAAAGQPAPQAQTKTPVDTGTAKTRGKHTWTETRIIRELHRHGIYW